ncbi:MAG TPA: DUF6526 family protein [Acidobacteriaceae bacterium]|nr:DUF6526 family protein [Acidobacteriaceae bacterium]
MSEPIQTRANHTRWDPAYHFFVMPVLALYFLWTVYRAGYLAVVIGKHRADFTANQFLHQALLNYLLPALAQMFVPAALLVLASKARSYALKVQDRVIRLEEQLRLATLLPESHRARLGELTKQQLIALRFAHDDEASALAARALDERLDPDQIKDAITVWRGDYWRA